MEHAGVAPASHVALGCAGAFALSIFALRTFSPQLPVYMGKGQASRALSSPGSCGAVPSEGSWSAGERARERGLAPSRVAGAGGSEASARLPWRFGGRAESDWRARTGRRPREGGSEAPMPIARRHLSPAAAAASGRQSLPSLPPRAAGGGTAARSHPFLSISLTLLRGVSAPLTRAPFMLARIFLLFSAPCPPAVRATFSRARGLSMMFIAPLALCFWHARNEDAAAPPSRVILRAKS